jgi:glycosyltransferase involved in cell wall biosynthesis
VKLCLNMIVRNEADRIARCLNAAAPFVSSYVIVDTGSTDWTKGIIRLFFDERGIPGEIIDAPFVNFSQARNAALVAARNAKVAYDYLLLVDADMELVVTNLAAFDNLTGESYDIIQKAGSLHYHNRRMLRAGSKALYRGSTHEYLDVESAGCIEGVHFIDHADGSNRKDKFIRDIALLEKDILADPNDGRSWFYLAQSYRDAGRSKDAAAAYRRRVALGGWDEEVWNSQLNYAHCLKDVGDEAGFVKEIMVAHNMRPSRAEALYDLSHYYRNKGMNAVGAMVAKNAMDIPYPSDALFVSHYAHTVGPREEFSICGFYQNETRKEAFKVCSKLSLDATIPPHSREMAKVNLYHYLEPLPRHVPYFSATRIPFVGPPGYIATNPSIVNIDGQLIVNVRCVNYSITESGHYMIRGTDGTANGENPIHTRNFLVDLSPAFAPGNVREIADMLPDPPAYNLVRGLEDLRLFSRNGKLWGNACVREHNADGYCEQSLVEITDRLGAAAITYCDYMIPRPRNHEKNWMPFPCEGKIKFVYRLGQLVDEYGVLYPEQATGLDVGNLSGGSQCIDFNGGKLCVVHEARFLPGEQRAGATTCTASRSCRQR